MTQNHKRLREQIFILHDLHNKWSPSNMADELQNSDCPPSQTRRALVPYIKYAMNRGTANPRRRSQRPRTPQFISLVKRNVENQRRKSIRKTDKLLKNHQLKSSYGSVQRVLKHDIKIKP